MASVSAFYTESENVMNRKVGAETATTDQSKLLEIYEVTRTINWIDTGKFHRVS